MTIEEVEKRMSAVFAKRERVTNIPKATDWNVLEAKFACDFSTPFKEFYRLSRQYHIAGLLTMQNCHGGIESDDIAFVYDHESREGNEWPTELIPFFAIGNGDYLCLDRTKCPASPVYSYSHEDFSVLEEYSGFEEWVRDLADWF